MGQWALYPSLSNATLLERKNTNIEKQKLGWREQCAQLSTHHWALFPSLLNATLLEKEYKKNTKKYKQVGVGSAQQWALSLSLLQPCWKNAKIIWHKIKQVLIVLIVKAATTGTSIFLLLQKTDPAGF